MKPVIDDLGWTKYAKRRIAMDILFALDMAHRRTNEWTHDVFPSAPRILRPELPCPADVGDCRVGPCVTSIAGPHGAAQLYGR